MSETLQIEVAPGTVLHTQVWAPAGEVRFVVMLAHGQGSYVGRFEELAADLNAVGALVFGPDHRGQGRSSGPMGYVERFEDYADDLLAVAKHVAALRPEEEGPTSIPWFLFGHSMGAVVSLIFALEHERTLPLKGLVISNPMLVPNARGAGVKQLLGKVLVKIAPKLAIPINLDRSLLFRDEERLAVYRRDEVGYDPLTPMFGEAWARAVKRVREQVGTIASPFLCCVGTGDQIIAPQPSIDIFEPIANSSLHDRTLEIFDGYYHEMHNEPPELRKRFVDGVCDWMLARLD